MKNGFRKLLATLCALALLLTSVAAVLADGETTPADPEQEPAQEEVTSQPAEEETEEEKEAEGENPEGAIPEEETPSEAESQPEEPAQEEEDQPEENQPDENQQEENNLPEEKQPEENPENAQLEETEQKAEESEQNAEESQPETTPAEAEDQLPDSDVPSETEEPQPEEENEFVSEPVQIDIEPETADNQQEEQQEEQPDGQPEEEPTEQSITDSETEETEEPEDESAANPNELRLGKKGIDGTLKAGETYTIITTGKYNYNLILTLTLKKKNFDDAPLPVSKDGTDTGVRVWFGDREKELTYVENEDPESTDVVYQFTAFTAKGETYEIKILSQFDAEFNLSAVKKPNEDKNQNEQTEEIKENESTIETTADSNGTKSEEEQTEYDTETEKAILSDEELIAMGFYKVQILKNDGTDIYTTMDENAAPSGHLDLGQELWVKPTDDRTWAEIYNENGTQYILWNDVLITLQDKPDENGTEDAESTEDVVQEKPYARSVNLTSTLDGVKTIEEGTEIVITATLEGFLEEDQYTIAWYYSSDGGQSYYPIESADGLEYRYNITVENAHNIWKIVISLE